MKTEKAWLEDTAPAVLVGILGLGIVTLVLWAFLLLFCGDVWTI